MDGIEITWDDLQKLALTGYRVRVNGADEFSVTGISLTGIKGRAGQHAPERVYTMQLQDEISVSALRATVQQAEAVMDEMERQRLQAPDFTLDAYFDAPKAGEPMAYALQAIEAGRLIDVMRGYMDQLGETPGGKLPEDFVVNYAAQLAVLCMQQSIGTNWIGWFFWMQTLAEAAPERMLDNLSLWLTYLHRCVALQEFDTVRGAIVSMARSHEDDMRKALIFTFMLNGQTEAAVRVLNRADIRTMAIHLSSSGSEGDPIYRRYRQLIYDILQNNRVKGCTDKGYLYGYIHARNFCFVLDGCLQRHFVHRSAVNAANGILQRETVDYPRPIAISYGDLYGNVASIQPIAINVEDLFS